MAEFLENNKEIIDPPLPKGYTAIKEKDLTPPLPKGYIELKKKRRISTYCSNSKIGFGTERWFFGWQTY